MIGRIANQDFSLFGLWPSHEQDIMLRAAILNGELALAAFHEWLGLIDLDQDFDPATFRLLPLLYGNLRKLGVTHPIMGRLKGVYRLTWYKNHKLFDSMRPVLAALVHAGAEGGFTYVSMAGGAFLEWMEGRALPGVEALKA